MTLLPSQLPSPRGMLARAGARLRVVLTAGLATAQALVDRLPDDGTSSAGSAGRATVSPIGSDRQRRHHSRTSRSLAR